MQAVLPVSRGVNSYLPDRSAGEIRFDPLIHLNIGQPEQVTILPEFQTLDLSLSGPNAAGAPPVATDIRTGHPTETSKLAFTSAFSVLSPAGVAAMRSVLAINQDLIKGNARMPRHIRGLAYTSQFVRELSSSPAILNHVSRLAGMPLIPHYMVSSAAHTNLSQDAKFYNSMVNKKQSASVDAWHVDSCPFVLIVVCSDMTGIEGGILQAVKRKGLPAARQAVADGLTDEDVLNVNYVQTGWGMFMQGAEILHRVTAVTKSREPRISVVLSFMPASVLHLRDGTAIGSWLSGIDGKSYYPEAAFEYTRGRAHRAAQQLEYLVDNMPFTEDRNKLAAHLEKTAKELAEASAALKGKRNDYLGFIDDEEARKGEENLKKKKNGNTNNNNLKSKL